MKRLTIILCILFASSFSFGQTFVNPGDGTLSEAIANAADGDILQLVPGSEYTESTNTSFGTLNGKGLTIEVPDAEAMGMAVVKINTADPGQFLSLEDGSYLTLDGIEFDGSQGGVSAAAHLLQFSVTATPVESNAGTVNIKNCLIHHFTDYVVGGGNGDIKGLFTLDSMLIDNTIIHNTGSAVYFKYNAANYLSITNTTIYDLDGGAGYGIRVSGKGESTFTDKTPVTLIDHTTWYNIGINDPREIILLEKAPAPDNSFTVTNSIFAKQVSGPGKTMVNVKELNPGVGKIHHIAYWDIGDVKWASNDVHDTLRTDPNFADPENGDFTIPNGSPLLTFGTNGGAIGDPRWTKNAVGVEDEQIAPLQYSLKQNYPNPFNPSTQIKYSLKNDGFVTIKIYNLLGKEIATLINGYETSGEHTINFNAQNLTSGIYFYSINSNEFNATKKMILLK